MKPRIVIVLLLLCLVPASLLGQWVRTPVQVDKFDWTGVGTWTTANTAGGGVFFSGGTLAVCSNHYTYPYSVWISKDTGRTWFVSLLPFGQSYPNNSTSVRFLDSLHGTAAVARAGDNFLSSDGGRSWVPVSVNPLGAGDEQMIATPQTIIKTSWGVVAMTYDGGTTWQNVAIDFSGIIAAASFAVTRNQTIYAGAAPLLRSTDLGRTWQKMPSGFDWASWSLAIGQTCYDTTLYVANDGLNSWGLTFPYQPYNNNLAEIDVSRDGGQSVVPSFVWGPPGQMTGALAASRHAAFFGTVDQGIFRTTDQGRTWVNIGGPSGVIHSRHIAAISDNHLFAVDSEGVLWETFNCGGQPINPPKPPMPYVQGVTIGPISSCMGDVDTAWIAHQFCHPLIVTDATIEGGDASYFTLASLTFPDTLGDGRVMKFPISFDPNKQVGTFTTFVRVRGVIYDDDDEDTVYVDTLIKVSASSKANGPNLRPSIGYFGFDTLSTCGQTQDTTVTLTNKGCDTLRIISGPNGLSPEFSLVGSLNLPIVLPPDSSVTVTFRFKPSGTGYFNCTPSFVDSQQTLKQTLTLSLDGYGVKEGGVFDYSPKVFSFPSLSICSHDSASGWMTNVGCDDLSFDSSQYFGALDFRVSGIGSRVSVKPGDTVRYSVYLNPARKGIRTGFLVLNSTDVNGTHRDSIPISVTVTDGTRFLTQSLDSISFGTTTLCDERDSVVVLHNTGCDTLVVRGDRVQGIGFTVDGFDSLVILPGDSVTVGVHTQLDTSGGMTTNRDTVLFISDADNVVKPILISRSVSLPVHYSFHMTSDAAPSGTAGQGVRFKLVSDQAQLAGVKTIDYDLALNTDLLGLQNAGGPNAVKVVGSHVTITGNPNIAVASDGSVATFDYEIYLTKDSTTNLTATNFHLNNTDPKFEACVASASTSDTAFNYVYQCSQHEIQEFLRTGTVRITSIVPNPATDEVELSIHSASAGDAMVEFVNPLGSMVYSTTKHLVAGENVIRIATREFAGGVYYLRLRAGGGVCGQSVVIER